MIAQKVAKPTRSEEIDAYDLATLRDRNTCQRCGRDCGPTARDHRKNRSQLGRTAVENLQCLGLDCHDWKGANPYEANYQGWGCPAWANPAQWPARRWIPTDHGTRQLAWVLYVTDIEYFDYPQGYRIITELDARNRHAGLVEGVRA